MKKLILSAMIYLTCCLTGVVFARESQVERLDKLFSEFDHSRPGCVVGIEKMGQPPVVRAYGRADMEYDVLNGSETIFEAGSVSKQFVAASVLLLEREGRLSLSDDVRKYIPEMPDYGHTITIADLLRHTSGLRDWGDVEEIAGWPRGDRVYNMSDILGIISHQRALNYPPGDAWSYTNSGYNLLAIILERVSKQSLEAFTREHIFLPLGMNHTRWRDDFRQIVPGRAVAYEPTPDGYKEDMPFENSIGNGGLLTTVPDLLIWNQALNERRLGKSITAEMERATHLKDGSTVGYGAGLFLSNYNGMREISHSGATAGYRAWLSRYPEQHLSVALLCNAGQDGVVRLGHSVVDVYAPREVHATPGGVGANTSRLAGWYADNRNGMPLHLQMRQGQLETGAGDKVELSPDGTLAIGSSVGKVMPGGAIEVDGAAGNSITYKRKAGYYPTPDELAPIAGRYRSDEADATVVITRYAEGLRLSIEGRPSASFTLMPAYAQAFTYANEVVRPIRRKATSSIVGLLISSPRVWRLRFARIAATKLNPKFKPCVDDAP